MAVALNCWSQRKSLHYIFQMHLSWLDRTIKNFPVLSRLQMAKGSSNNLWDESWIKNLEFIKYIIVKEMKRVDIEILGASKLCWLSTDTRHTIFCSNSHLQPPPWGWANMPYLQTATMAEHPLNRILPLWVAWYQAASDLWPPSRVSEVCEMYSLVLSSAPDLF